MLSHEQIWIFSLVHKYAHKISHNICRKMPLTNINAHFQTHTLWDLSWSLTLSKSDQSRCEDKTVSAWVTQVYTLLATSSTAWAKSAASVSSWVRSAVWACSDSHWRLMTAIVFCTLCFSPWSEVCWIMSLPLVRNLSKFCLNSSKWDSSSCKHPGEKVLSRNNPKQLSMLYSFFYHFAHSKTMTIIYSISLSKIYA